MRIEFIDRDGNQVIPLPVQYQVTGMRWSVRGGPESAALNVTGGLPALLSLFNYLRYGARILDDDGTPVWWGYVADVRVIDGAVELAADMDGMTNRVRAVYSFIPTGGKSTGYRKTTAWAEHAESIALYGVKESVVSLSGSTDEQATQKRDTVLATRALPHGGMSIGSDNGQTYALIGLRGWYDTLSWHYPAVGLGYTHTYGTTGTASVDLTVGASTANDYDYYTLYTAPTSAPTGNATKIRIYAKKVGTPTNPLKVDVYEQVWSTKFGWIRGEAPILSASIASADLGASYAWEELTFTPTFKIVPGKNYYVYVGTGAGVYNASNYYVVRAMTGNYPIFEMDTSMPASAELADVLKVLLSTSPYLTAGAITASASTSSGQYIDGDSDALTIIDAALDIGGVNSRPLVAIVNADNTVTVTEEAAKAAQFYLKRDGTITTLAGVPLRSVPLEVLGCWVQAIDAPIITAAVTDPALQFVEAMEWADGRVNLIFRGQIEARNITEYLTDRPAAKPAPVYTPPPGIGPIFRGDL